MTPKKKIIIIAAAFSAFTVLMIILAIITSRQYLTISFDSSKYSSVILYKGTDTKTENTIAPTKTVIEKSIQSGKEYFLPKGTYFLVAKSKDNIVSILQRGILLGSDKKSVSLDYKYTNSYLQKLTNENKKAIDSAILGSNSKISTFYTIKNEAVLEKGDWAIAALVFNGSGTDLNRDTLKVVLEKKDSKWVVKCKPMISISKYDCSAPQNILNKANSMEIVTQRPLMPNYNIGNTNKVDRYE